jgi:hypothetical protein
MKSLRRFWLIAPIAAIFSLLAAGCFYPPGYDSRNYSEARNSGIVVSVKVHDEEGKAVGDWIWRSFRQGRQYSGRPVSVLFEAYDEGGNQRYSSAYAFTDLSWTHTGEPQAEKGGGPIRFALIRPAGRWNFQGGMNSSGASGGVEFQPDAAFLNEVTVLCRERPSTGELIHLSITGVSIDGLRRYSAALQPLDVEGWLKLMNNGIKPEYAESMTSALGRISADALIECRNYGMTPGFAAGYSRAGYGFDYKELIQLKNYGVSADYAASLKRGGINLKPDQLVQLHNYGVQPTYVIKMKELGFGNNLEDVIQMRNYGVPEDFIAAVKDAGYLLSLNQIIELRNYGVSPGFLKAVKRMGYTFTVDEIIKLKNYGVSESYLSEILEPGRKPLSADVIIDLRSRGVPAEVVRRIRAQ